MKSWVPVIVFFFSVLIGLLFFGKAHAEDLPPITASLSQAISINDYVQGQALAPSPINPPYGDEVEWVFYERKEIGERVFLVSYGHNKKGEPAMDIKEITSRWVRFKLWFKGEW